MSSIPATRLLSDPYRLILISCVGFQVIIFCSYTVKGYFALFIFCIPLSVKGIFQWQMMLLYIHEKDENIPH